MFKSIEIERWRQFGAVEIEFHESITILTGANASGKTTILNVLAKHFGWDVPFVRTPHRWKKRWLEEFFESFWKESPSEILPEGHRKIGQITYSDGTTALLNDTGSADPTYKVEILQLQPVKGINIPSHRPIPTYQAVTSIPVKPRTKQEAFQNYMSEVRNRYLTGRSRHSTTYHIKETLVSLAQGYGNEKIPERPELVETFEGFEAILKQTLPPDLRFHSIGFDLPEVFLNTATGPIPFDAISGGMASILDIAWQIYMYSPESEAYVVIIDEPENHLHPALQRTVLSNFLDAFPSVQFIVATHSPFVVSSVPESRVYVLDYEDEVVMSTYLDTADKSMSADGILRDVLGVPSTYPVWVNYRLQQIIDRHTGRPLTSDSLRSLRDELDEAGLGSRIVDAIDETLRVSQS